MIKNFIDGEVLQYEIWHNTVASYFDVAIYFIISLIILYLIQKVLLQRFADFAQRTKTEIDDVFIEFIRSIRPQLYIILSIYVALQSLELVNAVKNILNVIVIVVVIFQITRSLQVIVEFIAKRMSADEHDEHTKSAAHLLGALLTVVIWIFGILMILSNIGVNVASLIAGVGIGGIAIAFAVREVLADLFSSFAIYLDKPFKAGDIIKINDDTGEVKKIGIKTTRIKSATGEEIIISNQDLTSSRVHNFKHLDHRTVTFHFGVPYTTSTEKLREIPHLISNMINKIDDVHCKRVHFKSFGERALEFEIVYVVETRKYSVYMDRQQEINLNIKELLHELGVALVHRADLAISEE